MKIDGIDYEMKELDFTNLMCDLEDKGINVLGFMEGDKSQIQVFKLCRGIVSIVTGLDNLNEAGKVLTSHFASGGDPSDIINPFMNAMENAGFLGEKKEPKVPQDRQSPQTNLSLLQK